MKIEIIYHHRKRKGEMVTVEFESVKEAFKFIIFNSPIKIEAIRVQGEI